MTTPGMVGRSVGPTDGLKEAKNDRHPLPHAIQERHTCMPVSWVGHGEDQKQF